MSMKESVLAHPSLVERLVALARKLRSIHRPSEAAELLEIAAALSPHGASLREEAAPPARRGGDRRLRPRVQAPQPGGVPRSRHGPHLRESRRVRPCGRDDRPGQAADALQLPGLRRRRVTSTCATTTRRARSQEFSPGASAQPARLPAGGGDVARGPRERELRDRPRERGRRHAARLLALRARAGAGATTGRNPRPAVPSRAPPRWRR